MTLGQIGVRQRTVVWNKQESRRKYWATRSSVRSLARTAHFAHPRLWESELFMSQNYLVLSHSAACFALLLLLLERQLGPGRSQSAALGKRKAVCYIDRQPERNPQCGQNGHLPPGNSE